MEKQKFHFFYECKNPCLLAAQWLEEATQKQVQKNPNAMVLSTCDNHQVISSRVVLAKNIDETSVYFYTNYLSHKGKDMEVNPHVGLNFHWDAIDKQISIQAHVEKLSHEESQRYWSQRERSRQISQYTSRQSDPVKDRETLEHEYALVEKKFENKVIPCPEHWGGYKAKIEKIEFWIANPSRFHDRFLFTQTHNHWQVQRLYP